MVARPMRSVSYARELSAKGNEQLPADAQPEQAIWRRITHAAIIMPSVKMANAAVMSMCILLAAEQSKSVAAEGWRACAAYLDMREVY